MSKPNEMACHPFTTDSVLLVELSASALPIASPEDSPEREYRPLALLEWVNDELRSEALAKAMRELAPSIPALIGHGCSDQTAQAHLERMGREGHIKSAADGWRVK